MNVRKIDVAEHRDPGHDVLSLVSNRWSPRAMSGEEVTEEELARLFEAARWAPSSYNRQPWRFLYARRGADGWNDYLDLLIEFNRRWAKEAGALIVILSRKVVEENGKPSRTHSFDTGAAWENLALQGSALGLVVHGMEGFDYDEARSVLGVPEEYDVEAMVAVGRPASVQSLPEELQEREAPSGRKELDEIAFEGRMPKRGTAVERVEERVEEEELRLKRILFPTDFSETASEALAQAAEVARFFGAELTILHVVDSLPADATPRREQSSVEKVVRALEKEAEERVTALSEVPDLNVRARWLRGDAVAPTINQCAEESDADLIVMASHGRRGVRRWLLGSVTEEVLRTAERPVLTLRRREHGLNLDEARSFLVPVDFSVASEEALAYARRLAASTGSSLHLLYVVETTVYPSFYSIAGAGGVLTASAANAAPSRERLTRELEELFGRTPGPDVPFEIEIEEGRPATRIVELAQAKSSDLIVMSSHGLSGLSHVLLGSVTEAVMRRANRPVLIVRSA